MCETTASITQHTFTANRSVSRKSTPENSGKKCSEVTTWGSTMIVIVTKYQGLHVIECPFMWLACSRFVYSSITTNTNYHLQAPVVRSLEAGFWMTNCLLPRNILVKTRSIVGVGRLLPNKLKNLRKENEDFKFLAYIRELKNLYICPKRNSYILYPNPYRNLSPGPSFLNIKAKVKSVHSDTMTLHVLNLKAFVEHSLPSEACFSPLPKTIACWLKRQRRPPWGGCLAWACWPSHCLPSLLDL